MQRIVGQLLFSSSVGFINCLLHAFCNGVSIKYYKPFHISCSTACRLGEAFFVAQKAFLIGIQNSHQRYLRQVEPFPQKIYTNQHINIAKAQLAQDFHPLKRIHFAVYVFAFYADALQIFVHFFSHAFGKCGYQHPVALLYPFINFIQQIINLVEAGPYFNGRFQQTCWPHNLLHHYPPGLLQFIVAGRCTNIHHLVDHAFKFVKI